MFFDIPLKPDDDDEAADVFNHMNNNECISNAKFELSESTYYTELFGYIEKNIIGNDKGFRGPFGDRLSNFLLFN